MNDSGPTVVLARGYIYLSLDIYETYFPSIESAALLKHEAGFLVLPLIQNAAGGLLIKMKNLKGDRVINAQEFFRNNQIDEDEERVCGVRWLSDRGGLLVEF